MSGRIGGFLLNGALKILDAFLNGSSRKAMQMKASLQIIFVGQGIDLLFAGFHR